MGEAKFILPPLLVLFFFIFMSTIFSSASQPLSIIDDRMQTYIVHVVKSEVADLLGDEELESWHRSFLPNTILDSGEPRLVYSYRHAISGFAARLTLEEVRAMEAMEGFLWAEPEHVYQLDTTHTPDFLGLNQSSSNAWAQSLMGEGIIIGVLDTGISPNHPSFGDSGMPPPPKRWNGFCNAAVFPACNNKIIGGITFRGGKTFAPTDDNGHGTHVASTAAGSLVAGAQVLGMARGTASGIAPKAHLAIYKVCHANGCPSSDILAATDQAVSDGVDVISMSISGGPNATFLQDAVVFGAFAAVEKGISAVASAGNRGPQTRSLSHSAPWVLAVGASSMDRKIEAIVKLGNGEILRGESAYQPTTSISAPIVYPGINGIANAQYCQAGSLDQINVRGKIVLCLRGGISNIAKGRVVVAAGGAAMIVMNLRSRGYTTPSEAHVLPVSHLSYMDGRKVRSYYVSNPSTATATIIFNGTRLGHRPSPSVAAFSSRGPSWTNGGILKPDVLAPGVNILAAWPFRIGPPLRPPASFFNFLSGTSMAAPHVAGTIALLKSTHPGWSPAAIQSAIITSAQELDLDGKLIVDDYEETYKAAGIFATGAGQLKPSGAMDPGLIYDLNPSDYIGYLCGLGYTDRDVTIIARRPIQCSTVKAIKASQLNYASITVNLKSALQSETIERTVTNVGQASSIYVARITEPSGVRVDLSSNRLRFSRRGEVQKFTVKLTLSASGPGGRLDARGKLEWVSNNGKYVAGSPIAVTFL